MNTIFVIGMGMSPADLPQSHLERIRSADILVGGRRHLAFFEDLTAEKIEIRGDLKALCHRIGNVMERFKVVVLASGDPLFYGIGAFLLRHLPRERVEVLPNVSAVAAAFSRIRMPWQNAQVVSFHGRNREGRFFYGLSRPRPMAVYTDPEHDPAWVARRMVERGVCDWRMCVLERIGDPAERIEWLDPAAAADRRFDAPNLVVLVPEWESEPQHPPFGAPEEAFIHQGGLITKMEARAVTLARLCLAPGMTLWDLGAGSGSVGIEAAFFLEEGRVIAVEKRPDRMEQILQNARERRVYTLETVVADLPKGLERLPDPDRIFIGGGGKKLKEIIRAAAPRLPSGGTLVVNTVLVDNLSRAVCAMESAGLATDILQLMAHRTKAMPWSRRLEPVNPVWILTGKKEPSRP